jgi:uncharacterized membrane protein YfcA
MEPSAAELALLGLAAVAGGAVNALAGGGTLITFPALTATGMPALTANVTNTVALVPGYLGGSVAQRADLHGQRRRVSVATPAAVAGGLAGGILLLSTGEALFQALVPWLILGAAALLAAEPWVRRAVARRLGTPHGGAREHPAGLALATFAGAVYGGYFGAGLGIIFLALFSLVLPETLTRVNALKQTASLAANVTAAVLFAAAGDVVWSAAAVMAAGALLGGALGGRLAGRVPAGALRVVVVAVGVVVAAVFFAR